MTRLICLMTMIGVTAGAADIQLLDRIVAVVDGSPITQSDVTAVTELALVKPSGGEPFAAVVDALVERRLMLQEVDRYDPPAAADAEIARRVEAIRARTGNRYNTVLLESGWTDDQVRREVRDDLRIETYLQQRFGTAGSEERAAMIREWLSGLRRRATVNILPR